MNVHHHHHVRSRHSVDLDDILPLSGSTSLPRVLLMLLWWPPIRHLASPVLLLLLLLSPLTLLLSLLMRLLLLLLASLLLHPLLLLLLLVGLHLLLLLLGHGLWWLALHSRNRDFEWRWGFVSSFHCAAQHALVEFVQCFAHAVDFSHKPVSCAEPSLALA
jgi:hypothetical protein